jgi:hypothetical protein
MINYSSINDAWGKKDIYKNNKIHSVNNNSKSNQPLSEQVKTIVPMPAKVPEQVQALDIKKDIFIETPFFEKFSSCNFMDHIKNCSECKEKFKNFNQEMFGQTNQTITLPGCNIKLSKDTLKVVFILIIICIILLFISIINENKMCPTPAYYNKYMYMPYNY